MSVKQSRTLRKNMTNAERKLGYAVRDRRLGDYKFRRQVPVGMYILDIACFEFMLAIEIDGGQHCENQADEKRTHWLEAHGWHVMRFWNNEVLQNIDGVKQTILNYLAEFESITPSPAQPEGLGDLSHREREFIA